MWIWDYCIFTKYYLALTLATMITAHAEIIQIQFAKIVYDLKVNWKKIDRVMKREKTKLNKCFEIANKLGIKQNWMQSN